MTYYILFSSAIDVIRNMPDNILQVLLRSCSYFLQTTLLTQQVNELWGQNDILSSPILSVV